MKSCRSGHAAIAYARKHKLCLVIRGCPFNITVEEATRMIKGDSDCFSDITLPQEPYAIVPIHGPPRRPGERYSIIQGTGGQSRVEISRHRSLSEARTELDKGWLCALILDYHTRCNVSGG